MLMERLQKHREKWLGGTRPERGLWLWGPTNARKTASVAALMFDVSHLTNRRCIFWSFEDLMKHLRRQAAGLSSDYDRDEIDAASMLILDDLGTIKPTEKAIETLYGIVEAANSAWGASGPQQSLYVTTNEGPEHLVEFLDGRCGQGLRIVRRLVQLCEVIDVGNS
jgi:DNA replication protein DnaC